jgi:hypothetical protein
VHRNTAFRWRHRFLARLDQQKATNRVGIAEADETFFLESFKGKKQGMERAPRKRSGKASKRGLSDEQIPGLICRDRTGNTTDFVLEKADKAHIYAALKPVLSRVHPEHRQRQSTGCRRPVNGHHPSQNQLGGGYPGVSKVYHVQNVNAYDSRLKTWRRRFQGVATHYLPSYLGWCRRIDRSKNALSPATFLSAAIGINHL